LGPVPSDGFAAAPQASLAFVSDTLHNHWSPLGSMLAEMVLTEKSWKLDGTGAVPPPSHASPSQVVSTGARSISLIPIDAIKHLQPVESIVTIADCRARAHVLIILDDVVDERVAGKEGRVVEGLEIGRTVYGARGVKEILLYRYGDSRGRLRDFDRRLEVAIRWSGKIEAFESAMVAHASSLAGCG
jgi:hypothetical protein